jgi:phosphatidylethanolamine-binding protein (PEBP) family uncharacterized protein
MVKRCLKSMGSYMGTSHRRWSGRTYRRVQDHLRSLWVDIDSTARDYVHWLVADISPKISSLPEAVSGDRTSAFNEIKPYIGPFPQFGTHDYEFTVYALRTDGLRVRHGASLEEFKQAAQRESLAAATLITKIS